MTCAFCERIAQGDLLAGNDLAVAFFDAYPVTPGHCLILPAGTSPTSWR